MGHHRSAPAPGIRIEELTELSHHSIIRYQVPGTGQLIPLLHIAPSKTDIERMVVSPELAEVLAVIVARVRDQETGTVPRSLPTTPSSACGTRRRRCCCSTAPESRTGR